MSSQYMDIEQLLAEGATIQIRPQGYSMYPLFLPGRDEAVVAPYELQQLRRGMVVLYRREGSILVLHRIWKADKTGIYLVGDNQKEIEGPLDQRQVRGIMVAFVRKGRTYSVSNVPYRMYAGLWLLLRPFRPAISHGVAAIKRCLK